MFLTKEEVAELTGAKQRAGQIQNLVANGIKHTIRVDGWPSVPRSAITGQKTDQTDTAQGGWQPRKVS